MRVRVHCRRYGGLEQSILLPLAPGYSWERHWIVHVYYDLSCNLRARPDTFVRTINVSAHGINIYVKQTETPR